MTADSDSEGEDVAMTHAMSTGSSDTSCCLYCASLALIQDLYAEIALTNWVCTC